MIRTPPKHWLIPNNLRDTPYDEANQNNWAWPDAQMKRNARASYRNRLVAHAGVLIAGVLMLVGFTIQGLS